MRRLRAQWKRKLRRCEIYLGDAWPILYVSAHMRFLRMLHLYLGCLFAPILIFFAITGSWQLFNWHESKKDKTYIAPPALAALSFVHKDAHIPGTPGRQPTP
ncbi:MAG: hypothetical protein DLM73_10675, partial [Chthoniobacterales bacterium]